MTTLEKVKRKIADYETKYTGLSVEVFNVRSTKHKWVADVTVGTVTSKKLEYPKDLLERNLL